MIKATDLITVPLVILTAIGVLYYFSEYCQKNDKEIFWILQTEDEEENEEFYRKEEL